MALNRVGGNSPPYGAGSLFDSTSMMRVALSSMTSTFVHAVALGGLAMWSLESFQAPQFQVASGQAVTVQFAPASASSEAERTIQIEAEPLPEAPVETHEVKHEAQSVEIQRKQTSTPPKAEPVRQEDAEELPLLDISLPTTKVVAEVLPESNAQTDDEDFDGKPTAQPPEHQVAAIPVEFQTAEVAGANNREQLPRKLPVNPSPPYPLEALLAGVEGRPIFRVRISVEGHVESFKLATSSGSEVLDNAAAATIRHWRFEPARRNGVPVEFEVLIPVTFSIRRS